MSEKRKTLLVLTGMSGAGKSSAVRVLEDFGFFCVDNVPPSVMPDLIELLDRPEISSLAIVVDIRAIMKFGNIDEIIKHARQLNEGIEVRMVFLDADDDTLFYRYSKTRRAHPLQHFHSLEDAIRKERTMITELVQKADLVINTSDLDIKELHTRLLAAVASESLESLPMRVIIESFGYTEGVPHDVNLLFDVRFLPNPYYVKELSELTGKDRRVGIFISEYDAFEPWFDCVSRLCKITIEEFARTGRNQFKIAVGCTGGRHRSVFVAEKLYELFTEENLRLSIFHRELRNG